MQKNKQDYVNELLQNPKYTSNFIEYASDLLSEGAFDSVEELEKFDSETLSTLKDATKYKDKIDIKKLVNSGLNATQMYLYILGVTQKNIPVEKMEVFLKHPDIPYAKMNYIIEALADGADLLPYVNFSTDQLYEIFAGVKSGIAYTYYAFEDLSAEKMIIVRLALEKGLSVEINKDTTIIIY